MAGGDLGEGTRLAAATGAYVCFEDEAGQNLRPPKARTWAPRGQTPVVRVSGKGSGRVSVAGLVCLQPGARGHLFYRVRIHRGPPLYFGYSELNPSALKLRITSRTRSSLVKATLAMAGASMPWADSSNHLGPPPGHHRPRAPADDPHQPPSFIIIDLTHAQPLGHPASLGDRAPPGNPPDPGEPNLLRHYTRTQRSIFGRIGRRSMVRAMQVPHTDRAVTRGRSQPGASHPDVPNGGSR